ncbi:MAG: aminotransferase class III-fold pyridoxal phosphate-dependent enzyme [Anaerolineales bacterium]|nr:aminotransferase class III-fold pyridoxal phosphate-dependent enzyme [Anaerolineales bacterium]
MKQRDHTRILSELGQEYQTYSSRSAALNERAKNCLIDGGSHTLRLISPFPPRIVSGKGAWIRDADEHDILDYWQGHYANILGHNPPVITSALAQAFNEGFGLQSGFTDELQIETAEILCKQTGAERVRFTTSGSLANMYNIMLARTFTGRELVMKVGGGWHGSQPWGLKGVNYKKGGFQNVESEGLPGIITENIIVTQFNDTQLLQDQFRKYGDRMACFILEIFIGVGGFVPASREFIETAWKLTREYGVLLIVDEVISGFRFRAGDTASFYGIQPDLSTFGKVMGGGMPVAAVAGRADILQLVEKRSSRKVRFSGGTYSAHPSSLLAAKTLMEYLIENELDVYPRLSQMGIKTRRTMEKAFNDEGIYARCTGDGNDILPASPLGMLVFPYKEGGIIDGPEYIHNPSVCDVVLSNDVLQLALLLENVHVVHGLGSVSIEHTDSDVEFLDRACRRVARRFKAYF